MKTKRTAYLFISLLMSASAQATPFNHSANQMIDILNNDLISIEQGLPADSTGTLALACLDYTFLKWAGAYNSILSNTPLDYETIKKSIDPYADNWFRARHNMAVEEFFYPEIGLIIENIINEGIIQHPILLSVFDAGKLKIDNIERANYDNYRYFCNSNYFLEPAQKTMIRQNAGQVIPVGIATAFQDTAAWRVTVAGGLEPFLSFHDMNIYPASEIIKFPNGNP